MRPRFVFILFELCYDLQQTLRRATIRGLDIQIGISDTQGGHFLQLASYINLPNLVVILEKHPRLITHRPLPYNNFTNERMRKQENKNTSL